jgi:hypothetical protein
VGCQRSHLSRQEENQFQYVFQQLQLCELAFAEPSGTRRGWQWAAPRDGLDLLIALGPFPARLSFIGGAGAPEEWL